MGSRKRGEIQTVVAASTTDKHKLWLIIGIVLAVVLVLAIVFLSPAREALFGKAITTVRGIQPGAPETARPGTMPVVQLPCMDIQLLPVRSNKNGITLPLDIRQSTFYRRNVCESAGCTFSGVDGSPSGRDTTRTTQNPDNDICTGTANTCPDISRYIWSGVEYETGRRELCEAQNCIFTSGGTISATNDICAPASVLETDIYCFDNRDNDRDGVIDGEDSDCKRQRCGDEDNSLVWTWSYLPTENPDRKPSRVGCCEVGQCQSGRSGCIDYGVNPNPTTICGSGNNWDICGNDVDPYLEGGGHDSAQVMSEGMLSNGRGGYCDGSEWTLCTDDSEGNILGDFICQDGLWDLNPNRPNVEICTDDIDNDGDTKTDCLDRDCRGNAACVAPITTPTVDLATETPGCGNNVCNAFENCASCVSDCSACPAGADSDNDGIPDSVENAAGSQTSSTSADSDGDGVNDGSDHCPGSDAAYPPADGYTFTDGLIAVNGCPHGDMANGESQTRPDGCFNDVDYSYIGLLYNPSCVPITYGVDLTTAAGEDNDGDGILNENDYCPGSDAAYPPADGYTFTDGLIAVNGCPHGDMANAVSLGSDGCFNDVDYSYIGLLYNPSCVPLG